MKRRAILIEASNVKGQDDLPGARVDIKNYTQYLTSQAGGYWYPDELVTLNKPSLATLNAEIKKAEFEAEYLFISFSGHGYMKRPPANVFPAPSETTLTILCLNDTQEISLSQINPTIKNFVIVDSCRQLEKLVKAMKIQDMMAFAESRSVNVARVIFDNAVRDAGPGQIIAYSCGVNETAGEDPNRGGFFSAAMMECGFNLSKTGQQRAIPTDQVFECAYRSVKTVAAQQNPKYLPGRRIGSHFPFAVKG
jgi:hypothetical protein